MCEYFGIPCFITRFIVIYVRISPFTKVYMRISILTIIYVRVLLYTMFYHSFYHHICENISIYQGVYANIYTYHNLCASTSVYCVLSLRVRMLAQTEVSGRSISEKGLHDLLCMFKAVLAFTDPDNRIPDMKDVKSMSLRHLANAVRMLYIMLCTCEFCFKRVAIVLAQINWVDMCENECMAYYGEHADDTKCSVCGAVRQPATTPLRDVRFDTML
jgi:hypothetical protein